MSNISWDEISRSRDTQQAFDTFHKHLVEIYNKHFPKIRIKRKYNNRKPWLSEGLKNSIKQNKNKFYLKLKKVNSAPNDELYKSYRRKLQQLIKVAEKHHYHDLLIKYSNNMKKSWGVIKSVINRNQKTLIQGRFKIGKKLITSDNELISNKFNDLFINIGPTLAKSIYLRVYSLHHNVLPTLQSIPLMTSGPLYPITKDSSCHGQHTMPRNRWSFPWPVLHSCVCMNMCVLQWWKVCVVVL